MRFIFDFLLITAFFIAYKVWNLYVATAVIMVGCFIQVLFHRWYDGHWDRSSLYLAIIVWLLGGLTLGLHDSEFIKWKPTVIYWIIAGTCFSSALFKKTPLLQKFLGSKITLPDFAWHKLNLAWAWFFLFLGALNIYVLMAYSTNVWVYFKLFGCVGLSILFLVGQGVYMARHMPQPEKNA